MAEVAPLRRLALRFDPWATEYTGAVQLDEDDDSPPVHVDPTVEMADWAPLTPEPRHAPASIAFVDGVQRVEARVLAGEGRELAYGAFVSIAVGAAVVEQTCHLVEPFRVDRILALTPRIETEALILPCGSTSLVFAPRWSTRPGYAGVADAIDSQRREVEMAMGQSMVDQGHPLVVLDGRLSLFATSETRVVGYTKTLHRRYLDPAREQLITALGAGQRTPLFQIDEERPLYSWYLRLSPRRPIDHPLAGIVRLETAAAVGTADAARVADQTALCLPAFASTPDRDPRAPQNLLPIGGLETRLRHELGDHAWLRRSIEQFLYLQTAS